MRSERVQNDLGATAGLRYRNGRPRTSVTERVSGGGEPHPESPGAGSAVTLTRRKSHIGGDRSPAGAKGAGRSGYEESHHATARSSCFVHKMKTPLPGSMSTSARTMAINRSRTRFRDSGQNPRYWTEWTETRKCSVGSSSCRCMMQGRINSEFGSPGQDSNLQPFGSLPKGHDGFCFL